LPKNSNNNIFLHVSNTFISTSKRKGSNFVVLMQKKLVHFVLNVYLYPRTVNAMTNVHLEKHLFAYKPANTLHFKSTVSSTY